MAAYCINAMRNPRVGRRQQGLDGQHGRDVRAAFRPRVVDGESFLFRTHAEVGIDRTNGFHSMALGAQLDHFLERAPGGKQKASS